MESVTYLNKKQLDFPKSIDSQRVLKYLGDNAKNQKTFEMIANCSNELSHSVSPKVVYGIFDHIPEQFIVGEDIKKHLSGCYGLLVFAVTLGLDADKFIKKLGYTDIFAQVVCDCVASVAIEQISEEFEAELKKEFEKQEIFTTLSYAPGYGDYPLETLPKYLSFIDAERKIGVSLTQSGFMTPRKSICAVIGLSKNQVHGFRAGCEHCKMKEKCAIRKEGKTCVR